MRYICFPMLSRLDFMPMSKPIYVCLISLPQWYLGSKSSKVASKSFAMSCCILDDFLTRSCLYRVLQHLPLYSLAKVLSQEDHLLLLVATTNVSINTCIGIQEWQPALISVVSNYHPSWVMMNGLLWYQIPDQHRVSIRPTQHMPKGFYGTHSLSSVDLSFRPSNLYSALMENTQPSIGAPIGCTRDSLFRWIATKQCQRQIKHL